MSKYEICADLLGKFRAINVTCVAQITYEKTRAVLNLFSGRDVWTLEDMDGLHNYWAWEYRAVYDIIEAEFPSLSYTDHTKLTKAALTASYSQHAELLKLLSQITIDDLTPKEMLRVLTHCHLPASELTTNDELGSPHQHTKGQTPIGGYWICRDCGENLAKL